MEKTDPDKDDIMLDDQALETFFDAARVDYPVPSEALLSAIMTDADVHQPKPGVLSPSAHPSKGSGRRMLDSVLSAIGGWPAVAGMASATVAGVWIGFASPLQLETLSGGLVLTGTYMQADETYALEDLTPSYLSATFLMEDEG